MTEEANKTDEGAGNSGSEVENKANGGAAELSPEKKLIEEMRARAETAEKRAQELERERDIERTAKKEAQTNVKTAMEKQIQATEETYRARVESAKTAFESAQREFEEAHDSGDRKRLLDAQIKLNDAQSALRGAEFHNHKFQEWKDQNKDKLAVVSSAQSNFTPKEQEWIKNHPRFNTDRKYRAAVYAGHDEAVELGIEIDSDAYFKHIEGYLSDAGLENQAQSTALKNEPAQTDDGGEEEADEGKKQPVKKQEKKQSASSTAVPAGSSTGSSSSGKKQSFTMTPEMRSMVPVVYPELYKKDPKAAEEKYAQRQLEIQQKKARGEL